MDLKSMLNASEGAASRAQAAPGPPPPQQQQQQQAAPHPHPPPHPHPHPQPHQLHMPSTPGQAAPPQSFRDYSQSSQASPGRPGPPHDYVAQQQQQQQQQTPTPTAAYPSPTSYPPPGAGAAAAAASPYGSRPAPPPLQPPSNDARSPSSMPAPSPYRQTPTSSVSGVSGGYPFPPTQPSSAASPVQRHQYPPTGAYPPRESFSQPSGVTGPPGHQQQQPPPAPQQQQQQQPPPQQQQQQPPPHHYMQGPPMPHTPPVGTPGGAHPSLYQRSQSTHSTPTPTSAQSQHHHGPPYGQQQPQQQGSPVVAHHNIPPQLQAQAQRQVQALHQIHTQMHPQQQQQQQPMSQSPYEPVRHPSQPPTTPLGPPLSTPQRHASVPTGFAQPTSPYQQRLSSAAAMYPHPSHASPPPPVPMSISRMSSASSVHEHQPAAAVAAAPPPPPPSASAAAAAASELHRRSQSRSERDRSVSVSPKTRIPSLPSSAGHTARSHPDSEPRHVHMMMASSVADADLRGEGGGGGAVTPAKRKLDELELRSDELERQEQRPPPFEGVNGSHTSQISRRPSLASTSRASASPVLARKKKPRPTAPPRWAIVFDSHPLEKPNFVVRKGAHAAHIVNGKSAPSGASRQTSPEAARSSEKRQLPPQLELLGPWEACINNLRPADELATKVADWLYFNIVGNPHFAEIQSRNVQFEIEAKLGELLSKDTGQRIDLPISTECLLTQNSRVQFQSSMTLFQHKSFNDLLNSIVLETHPDRQAALGIDPPRVKVEYKHRREIDRFFELPHEMKKRLPECVLALIPARHSAKVRVTYDQKTKQEIAKIVKARVNDLDIYMPGCPLDCRISINLEAPWDGPVEELEQAAASLHRDKQPDRSKDRLSYKQGNYQIDLTQVSQMPFPGGNQQVKKEHELEIEVSSEMLIEQGQRLGRQDLNAYAELVDAFVDNVRFLSRKAGTFNPDEAEP